METQKRTFDELFRASWDKLYEDTSEKSIFKSRLTGTTSKTVDFGYSIHYNPDILLKKPPKAKSTTSDTVKIEKPSLLVPFDDTRWNFLKINRLSMLACYDAKTNSIIFDASESIDETGKEDGLYHFYANEYPLMKYHVLVVPSPSLKYPQAFRKDCFLDLLRSYYYCIDTDKYW